MRDKKRKRWHRFAGVMPRTSFVVDSLDGRRCIKRAPDGKWRPENIIEYKGLLDCVEVKQIDISGLTENEQRLICVDCGNIAALGSGKQLCSSCMLVVYNKDFDELLEIVSCSLISEGLGLSGEVETR